MEFVKVKVRVLNAFPESLFLEDLSKGIMTWVRRAELEDPKVIVQLGEETTLPIARWKAELVGWKGARK